MPYSRVVIGSFKSRALKALWDANDASKLGQAADWIKRVLSRLDTCRLPEEMEIPGFRFHRLRGNPVRYSVRITANWRVTFEWEGEHAERVDYEDHH